MTRPHQHNTKTNKTQHTQAAALRPKWTGQPVVKCKHLTQHPASLSGLLPDVRIRRTRIPVGRTSLSTQLGATIERPADVPLDDRDVAPPRSGWLSSCSTDDSVDSSPMQDRSAVTPAVAYDGDVVVSRRTLAPGLVRRTDAAPCVLQQQRNGTAVPSRQRRQHSRCEAPLRQPKSLGLCALSLSAHCRALSQLSLSPLDFSHSYRTLQNMCVL